MVRNVFGISTIVPGRNACQLADNPLPLNVWLTIVPAGAPIERPLRVRVAVRALNTPEPTTAVLPRVTTSVERGAAFVENATADAGVVAAGNDVGQRRAAIVEQATADAGGVSAEDHVVKARVPPSFRMPPPLPFTLPPVMVSPNSAAAEPGVMANMRVAFLPLIESTFSPGPVIVVVAGLLSTSGPPVKVIFCGVLNWLENDRARLIARVRLLDSPPQCACAAVVGRAVDREGREQGASLQLAHGRPQPRPPSDGVKCRFPSFVPHFDAIHRGIPPSDGKADIEKRTSANGPRADLGEAVSNFCRVSLGYDRCP